MPRLPLISRISLLRAASLHNKSATLNLPPTFFHLKSPLSSQLSQIQSLSISSREFISSTSVNWSSIKPPLPPKLSPPTPIAPSSTSSSTSSNSAPPPDEEEGMFVQKPFDHQSSLIMFFISFFGFWGLMHYNELERMELHRKQLKKAALRRSAGGNGDEKGDMVKGSHGGMRQRREERNEALFRSASRSTSNEAEAEAEGGHDESEIDSESIELTEEQIKASIDKEYDVEGQDLLNLVKKLETRIRALEAEKVAKKAKLKKKDATPPPPSPPREETKANVDAATPTYMLLSMFIAARTNEVVTVIKECAALAKHEYDDVEIERNARILKRNTKEREKEKSKSGNPKIVSAKQTNVGEMVEGGDEEEEKQLTPLDFPSTTSYLRYVIKKSVISTYKVVSYEVNIGLHRYRILYKEYFGGGQRKGDDLGKRKEMEKDEVEGSGK